MTALCRPLAPGIYNITAAMAGYASETVTVVVPEGGEGVQVEFFLAPMEGLGGLAQQWGLGRKFGPFQLAGDRAEGEPGGQVRRLICTFQGSPHLACREGSRAMRSTLQSTLVGIYDVFLGGSVLSVGCRGCRGGGGY